jgi:hypothetical protein
MTEFTCKGCGKRVPGCHGSCDKYKAEKAAHEARKKEEQNQKRLDEYQSKAIQRSVSKRGRKWGTQDRRNRE